MLDEWHLQKHTDLRWLAYIMATVFHETARTMQPIEEFGKGKNYDYGKKLKRGRGRGHRIPYTRPDKIYYGRGHVQLTWYENYETMGRLLGLDLLNKPELALEMEVSIKILFEGMLKGNSNFGDFTGRCLEQYFNDTTDDPIGARRVVNGLDKAELIAGYYHHFLIGLS
jgi:putative chitinase